MAERRRTKEDPFEKLGFHQEVDEDGKKRLVFHGNVLKLSELDLDNKSGIKVVLPDGSKKVYKGVHRSTIQANRIIIVGDFNF